MVDLLSSASASTCAAVPVQVGNFDLVKNIQLAYTKVSVSKWRSRRTGLSVVHLGYDAPIVKGYFVVASEIFDDTGRPHTLEHLVFMGSERYPYKGVLDQLANRAFSEGTNAWTEQDHTAYTLATAGSQGFLQLLPVYMDHILYPTLRPSGFLTEVHHIDPEGQDSGVVYSEMQGRQNTSPDIMSLKMQQLVNPLGTAYRSETAGLMEALRVLNNDQIKEYHKTYYVPYNLVLIIAGSIATQDLLNTLQREVEPKIIQRRQFPPPPDWKRPFVETATALRKPLTSDVQETVEFPEHDESTGEIYLTIPGPPPTDYLNIDAIDTLGTYLTSSATAALNKEFIEIPSPLCTYIHFEIQSRASFCEVSISLGGVPVEHLHSIDSSVRRSLREITASGIDMERMSMVLKRERRKFYNVLESSKGDAFSDAVIEDFLYGDQEGRDLAASLDAIERYKLLESWSSERWSDLLQRYFVDGPVAVVRGKPSAALAEKLAKDEQLRVEAQVAKLGPHGLARAAKQLSEAKAEHDQPIPAEMITSFKVPNVSTISWIPVQSYRNSSAEPASPTSSETLRRHVEQDGHPLPLFVQFDHVDSDFVSIHALFSLEKVPMHLLPYLSLFQNAIFSLPVIRSNGTRLSHEEVVDQLDRDTVSYDASLGFDSAFSEMARVSIKVEVKYYDEAVAWLRDVIFGSELDTERLSITVARMLQSLPEVKRDGESVLGSIAVDLLHTDRSSLKANSLLTQMAFLPHVAQLLRDDPGKVVFDLQSLRNSVYDASGARISVTGNVLGVQKPRGAWRSAFQVQPVSLTPVPLTSGTLSEAGRNPHGKAVVVSMPSIESSFSIHIAKGIQGFDHEDYPALRVALEVLNALESYLWRYIRGSGLAYGASVGADLEAGQVSFSIYRSPNAFKAFEEGAKVLRGLATGAISMEETLIDSAKSSIVFALTSKVASSPRAALTSFINQALKNVPQDHHRTLLERCQAVSSEDVLAALRKYVLPIFDAKTSVAVVVTAPGKSDDISELLARTGFDVERRSMDSTDDESGMSEDSSTYASS